MKTPDGEMPFISENYSHLHKLGEGGMGDVYLARDHYLNQSVAIKVLKPSKIPAEQQSFLERFQAEALAVSRLNHPNIVSLYNFGESRGVPYLIMEYVEGRSLRTLIEEMPRVPVSLGVTIAVQICSAMAYIHQHNIIHRDIKPENILITREGIAKLTDFGLVKTIRKQGAPAASVDQDKMSFGTLKYAAPEQILDANNVHPSSDIYALGVTLFELLSADHPFQAKTVAQFIQRIFESETPSLQEIYWDIPEALDHIVQQAIACDAKERYQDAATMARALSQFVDHQGLQKVLDSPLFRLNTPRLPTAINHLSLKNKAELYPPLFTLGHHLAWLKALSKNLPFKTSQNLPKTSFLERVVTSGFTGIIEINHDLFGLVQNGYFLDFVSQSLSTLLPKTGDELFAIMPEILDNVHLHPTPGSLKFLPVLLAHLLNLSLHTDDSALHGQALSRLSEALAKHPQYTGFIFGKTADTLYCLAYAQGEFSFCLELNQMTATLSQKKHEELLALGYQTYTLCPAQLHISNLNASVLLRHCHLKRQHADPGADLRIQFSKALKYPAIDILNQHVSARAQITHSPLYQTVEQLLPWMPDLEQGRFYSDFTHPYPTSDPSHPQQHLHLDFCGLSADSSSIRYALILCIPSTTHFDLAQQLETLHFFQQNHIQLASLTHVFLFSPLSQDSSTAAYVESWTQQHAPPFQLNFLNKQSLKRFCQTKGELKNGK